MSQLSMFLIDSFDDYNFHHTDEGCNFCYLKEDLRSFFPYPQWYWYWSVIWKEKMDIKLKVSFLTAFFFSAILLVYFWRNRLKIESIFFITYFDYMGLQIAYVCRWRTKKISFLNLTYKKKTRTYTNADFPYQFT